MTRLTLLLPDTRSNSQDQTKLKIPMIQIDEAYGKEANRFSTLTGFGRGHGGNTWLHGRFSAGGGGGLLAVGCCRILCMDINCTSSQNVG